MSTNQLMYDLGFNKAATTAISNVIIGYEAMGFELKE